jgi:hypothetical protein
MQQTEFKEIQKELFKMEKYGKGKVSVNLPTEDSIFAKLESRDEEGHHLIKLNIWHNTELGFIGKIEGYNLVEDFAGNPEEALQRFKNAKLNFFSN